jgi:DNA uptake protein ComE-like DNA-binding protein
MIKQITTEQASVIIETREPHGYFYAVEDDGSYTGIDNNTGHAWTEEFHDFNEMTEWLRGGLEVGDGI